MRVKRASQKRFAIQLAFARPLVVVIAEHKSREQDEIAHRDEARVDYRRQEQGNVQGARHKGHGNVEVKIKPLGIGEVEENDVDGREASQAC